MLTVETSDAIYSDIVGVQLAKGEENSVVLFRAGLPKSESPVLTFPERSVAEGVYHRLRAQFLRESEAKAKAENRSAEPQQVPQRFVLNGELVGVTEKDMMGKQIILQPVPPNDQGTAERQEQGQEEQAPAIRTPRERITRMPKQEQQES